MLHNGENIMRRSMTAALISVILILVLGGAILGFVSSQSNATHGDHNEDSHSNNHQRDTSLITRGMTNEELKLVKQLLENEHTDNATRLSLLRALLANATSIEINGTVAALVKNKLILNATTGHMTIILPAQWTVGTKVMTRAQLFNGNFTAVGKAIKVTALKLTLFENQNININILFGYKITNADSMTAFALLPFNIETKT